MDAVTFIKEKERMCQTCGSCVLCPAWLDDGCVVSMRSGFAPEQQIEIVEKWSKEHQPKTRQSVFLKQFPDAHLDSRGVLAIQPCDLGFEDICNCSATPCYRCRETFWKKPTE